MLSRIQAVIVAFLALTFLAVAAPGGVSPPPVTKTVTVTAQPTATQPASQCNTGSIQCCDSVQQATSPDATGLFGLLNIVLTELDVLVGITCSPLSLIGIGGNSCSASPVCCENNSFGGLISIGCIPIILEL